jgi:hypothetical protein
MFPSFGAAPGAARNSVEASAARESRRSELESMLFEALARA